MSEALDSKRYLYTARDGQDGGTHRPFEEDRAACSSVSQLHLMGGYVEGLASEGSDSSSQGPPTSPRGSRKMVRSLHQEDVEMKSSGSSGSGTESHGNESHGNESHGNESHGNESHGNESLGSSNGNSKDSALLQSSASNKSSNSHSPSPRSSSNAYSLLSASSEQDNPSTSGCSSEESAKAKIQKELLKTLKELKRHLPSEKRNKRSTSNTLNTLKYALRCVKQVKANEEYYQLLMINDSQPSGFDVSSYTIEEIDSITSEYTLKNTDIFAVAVSLITGKIVYISDQASSILNCKQDAFKNGKFVEFLSPQDVSVFYSFTTPYRLPSWSMCTGAESSPSDCMQEKSFFCRISGGRERGGDLQYYPFRMTPYLMKVQDTTHSEDQFCCLLLAERVHSGYEAPRIPTDKRIFTTTHTPNCMFQDVDERAVPLLGYLPQDLIGTPVLLHLHPNDRPIMLAVHRKILQFAGQPFDHSSIRFCTNNGEYITIDTSWSSFVNPWSHKVSFIIGRHKVRMGPVNEDVFAAPPCAEGRPADSDIQEITESIHRLLLQPVHSNGSSGYGSNEHMLNAASSSDSNGNGSRAGPEEEREEEGSKAKPRTFHEICKGVHMQKNQEQQVSLSFSAKTETKRSSGKFQQKISVVRPRYSGWKENMVSPEDRSLVQEDLTYKDQTVNSYQQISCLDSVIRYLESCSVPITVKRKCQSSSNTTSSNSDEDSRKTPDDAMQGSRETRLLEAEPGLPSTKQTAVGSSLVPLARPSKAESVVSLPSQCSYSSTIVHVGDKKPQPESEIIEDMAGIGETVDVPVPVPPPSALSPPSQERGSYKKLGLTKQVLAAHTQKEEQTFLYRFRELRGVRAFQADCSLYLDRQRGHPGTDAVPSGQQCNRESGGAEPVTKCGGGAGASFWKGGRHRKTKCKRAKQQESSDSTASQSKQHRRAPPQGLNQASRSPSDNSQSTFPVAFPTVMPGYPMQMYPGTRPEPSLSGFGSSQCNPMQPTPFSTPMVTPVVALVLPNYVFPQMGGASQQTFYPQQTSILAQPEFPVQAQPAFPVQAQPAFPVQAQPAFPVQAQPAFPVQTQFTNHSSFLAQMAFTNQPFPYSLSAESPKTPVPEVRESLSRSSTPQTAGARDRGSPPLFQSRCSSPLQLNLLQLEETPRSVERQECMAPSAGAPGSSSSTVKPEKELPPRLFPLPGPVHSFGTSAPFPPSPGPLCAKDTRNLDVGLPCLRSEESLQWSKGNSKLRCCFEEVGSLGDGQQSDGNSSSSDLLDILLQEDSRSGTGSATSGSLGSGSNGMSVSGRGSSSNNSSQYFGSVDSSQDSRRARTCGAGAMEVSESGHPVQYVLQDPPWLLMANVDQAVMMTYQLPSRDAEKVLKEDREKLRRMQKSQPRFTENQRKELVAVQPWMRKGGLPKAIDVKACSCCEEVNSTLNDDETPDLDMGETCEDYASRKGSEDPGLPGPVSSLVP